jgi:hypothetical protein
VAANIDDLITCASCLTANHPSEVFCHECGAPVGATATLDPINQIHAQGHLFRTALEGRPRFIVLLGMWIMFLPLLVVSASVAVYLITNHNRRSDFVFFWGAAGLAYVSLVILYRITKNYLTTPNKDLESD